MKKIIPLFLAAAFCFLKTADSYSQGCCSGGSGSPIAGGASAGVLLDRQMEVASNFQYIYSNKFLTRDKDTVRLFDHYISKYIYSKVAYGFTKDLTVSLEAGYFIDKTQVLLFDSVLNTNKKDQSSGIADLIIFPRYDVLNRTSEKKRVELTLGLGYKIPLGKHNDSSVIYTNPVTGNHIYSVMPALVQPTTGSQDIIFYTFFYRGFPMHNFRVFANGLYIMKGWNSLGEKFGDYSSLGLFAGKTFFKNLGVTLQLRGERISKMKVSRYADLIANNVAIDTASTGMKKIVLAPQLSYSFKSFTFFALTEIPLYEYVNGTQLASQYQVTAGVSYRFFTAKSIIPKAGETYYECPMKCEGLISKDPGKCKICSMDLEEKNK